MPWRHCSLPPPVLQPEPVFQAAAEVGGPAWLFGGKAYHVLSSGHVLAVYSDPPRAGRLHGVGLGAWAYAWVAGRAGG